VAQVPALASAERYGFEAGRLRALAAKARLRNVAEAFLSMAAEYERLLEQSVRTDRLGKVPALSGGRRASSR
jgi:hypothetical protein